MNFSINGSKNLYESIKHEIIRKIITKELLPGEKITSVRQQAINMNVNPQTVQKAYNMLIEQGLLTSKPGSGNFVTSNKNKIDGIRNMFIDKNIDQFISFIDDYEVDKKYVINRIKEKDE